MTRREQEILRIIVKEPMISQEEIANRLGIARPSVAVHVKHLVEKGYIVGRGYILAEDADYCLVIGGSNIDITGRTKKELSLRDSNQGEINISYGGVARNIAVNLASLSMNTKMVTALGDDAYGKMMAGDFNRYGVNIDHSFTFENSNTSMYVAVLDHQKDMYVGISDMKIMDLLTVDLVKTKKHLIDKASYIIADANLDEAVLEYLVANYGHKLFVDPVSTQKAKKLKKCLNGLGFLKPNKLEAEVLSGMKINNEADLVAAGKKIISMGTQCLVISDGDNGAYYFDEYFSYHTVKDNVTVLNSTGAGDAFLAGFIFGMWKKMGIEDAMRFATAASIDVLKNDYSTISRESKANIIAEMEDVKICRV